MQKTTNQEVPDNYHVVRSDYFEMFHGLFAEGIEKLNAAVNEKKFTLKDSEVTHRTLNHWMEEGIIADTRIDNPNAWRRLSLVDLLWLELLSALREFGLSIPKLKNTFQTFFFKNGKPTNNMEIAIGFCLHKINIFLVVFDDGSANIATDACLKSTDEKFFYPSHIRLSINAFLHAIYPKADGLIPMDREWVTNASAVENAEWDVIEALRAKETSEVQVTVNKGKIKRVDTKQNIDPKKRIVDLINQTGYGDIQLRIEKHKIVDVQLMKKKKPC